MKDLNNNESIINFAYFTANFPHDFISKCWENNPSLGNHLKNKFVSKNGQFISCGDFMSWFLNLDVGNQNKLLNWIDDNYRAF